MIFFETCLWLWNKHTTTSLFYSGFFNLIINKKHRDTFWQGMTDPILSTLLDMLHAFYLDLFSVLTHTSPLACRQLQNRTTAKYIREGKQKNQLRDFHLWRLWLHCCCFLPQFLKREINEVRHFIWSDGVDLSLMFLFCTRCVWCRVNDGGSSLVCLVKPKKRLWRKSIVYLQQPKMFYSFETVDVDGMFGVVRVPVMNGISLKW